MSKRELKELLKGKASVQANLRSGKKYNISSTGTSHSSIMFNNSNANVTNTTSGGQIAGQSIYVTSVSHSATNTTVTTATPISLSAGSSTVQTTTPGVMSIPRSTTPTSIHTGITGHTPIDATMIANIISHQLTPLCQRLTALENACVLLTNNQANQGSNANQAGANQPLVNAITDAFKAIRLTSVTSNLPVPKFDTKKTTATAYLTEVERYFAAQNHTPDQFLYLIKSIMPQDLKVWYDYCGVYANDWVSFKAQFIAKYDNWDAQNERITLLQSKEQQLSESTESFIYEMLRLAFLCNPLEPMECSVQRAQNSLFPPLRLALGTEKFTTVDDLMQACRRVYRSIQANDRMSRTQTALPPLTKADMEKKDDKKVENRFSGSRVDQSAGKTTNPSSSGSYRGPKSFKNFYQVRKDNETKKNTGNFNTQRKWNNQKQEKNGSQDNTNRTNKPVNMRRCLKCHGYGHNEKACPTSEGVALMLQQANLDESLKDEKEEENSSPDHLN